MQDMQGLTEKIRKFINDRDWQKYHSAKDIAISIVLEAGELLENFQWKSTEEAEKYANENKERIGDELADIMNYAVGLADILNIDLLDACDKKIDKNDQKYPVDKIKGAYKKYDQIT